MATRIINGTSLEVVEQGTGDPVLHVHGSSSDHRTWRAQLDLLGERYRALAYSRRYHWPNRPIPDGADYAMREHVDDLRALLHDLDAGPVHLVGHSYGALVTLLLAVREPDLVRSLVLAEPPAITLFVSNRPRPTELLKLLLTRPQTALAIIKFGAKGIKPATAAARRGDMNASMRIFGAAVLGSRFHTGLPAARRKQVAANAIAAEFLGSGFPPLIDSELRGMTVPTLLVGAEHSPALFHRLLDRLEELLPSTERVEIRGASHIMHEDQPAAYAAAVGAFLAARAPAT
jgi:pimeloyl-ACP methyl ester carboxylesterase